MAISPDGETLATSSNDDALRLWKLSFSSWVESGCRMVGRNLTLGEWNQVAASLPYERTCPDLPAGDGAPPDAPAARYGR